MNSFLVKDVPTAGNFSKAVYLDKKFVVAAPEVPLGKTLVDSLTEWDFKEVFSEGDLAKFPAAADAEAKSRPAELAVTRTAVQDEEKLLECHKFYISFEKYVRVVFDRFTTKNHLDYGFIMGSFKVLLDAIRKDYRYILQIQPQEVPEGKDYLVFQTMSTTILSIVIGDAMRLSDHWLTELGIAALFHDIGMLKLPPESYLGKGELSEEDRKMIYVHPIAGHNLLKGFDFPPVVSKAVLEHHERENGTGYPNRKSAESIHLYAKIITVACSYAAIMSNRPYRAAMDGHTGMLELLENKERQYNEKVIQALVSALSVFPFGLYVLLSDGRKGQVVEVNHRKPHCPVVRLLNEYNGDGTAKTIRITDEGTAIVRALSSKEAEG